jgi:hypothetical protein
MTHWLRENCTPQFRIAMALLAVPACAVLALVVMNWFGWAL